jgi:ADP-heptose:LPS heptosyltransferase
MKIKFLILRFSSIGDIVLTTPVIRCLKQQVEGSVIHFATKKQYLPLLQSNPYIDAIHCLEDSMTEFIRELEKEQFDYIIDLHHNLRTFLIKSKLRIVDFSFRKLNIEKWLKVNFKIDRLPRIHIVERYMETLSLFEVENDQKGLDYFIPETDSNAVRFLPEEFRNGYIVLVIGARHFTKQLPVSKLTTLCSLISEPVILLGGKEDHVNGETVVGQALGNVYNACGLFSINQSASLVQQARVVITPDTGLMHIAAAFKKQILSIWGNTVPEFGMFPYLPDNKSQIIQVEGLSCRPCSKIGHSSCPKKHFRCMNDIDEKMLAALAKNMY